MASAKLPTSMQEACKMLKEELSDEDILLVKQGKVDATDLHFSLGLWIRNSWIYKGLSPEVLGLESIIWDADGFSDDILESFIKYIKEAE